MRVCVATASVSTPVGTLVNSSNASSYSLGIPWRSKAVHDTDTSPADQPVGGVSHWTTGGAVSSS